MIPLNKPLLFDGDRMKILLLAFLSTVVISKAVSAQEPAYCDPENFYNKEVDLNARILRDRAFKLGNVILLGGAIGYSNSEKVIDFVEEYSNTKATASEKYCTWYYNDHNDNAAAKFNHFSLTNPKQLTVKSGPAEYRSILKDQFSNSKTSFLSCMEKNKILVMGCDAMMHRGPSVFGMLLGFSGCSSSHALTIVNHLWGKHGVDPAVRQAIIEEGVKLGNEDPKARLRMQKAMGY